MADASSKQLPDSDDGAPCPKTGDVIAGKYRVERVVGTGGMGVVLSARHMALGQSVAIKILRLPPEESSRQVEAHARFLREGQAAARLASEHVVRIQDVGTTDDGQPFMVMELLSGSDLAEALVRYGPAPIDMAVICVHQACDAVGEAHRYGIVHRDLKPSNLFLSKRSDGHPHVKVLDFGISKGLSGTADDALSQSLTATRTVVGSPYYMSPEQVRDAKRVDARTDIWSLGMILYELIAGEPAFQAETLPGMCAAIAADTPPSLTARRSDIPPALEALVMRCLEKDPGKRFQTVADLARALEPFLPRAPASSAAAWLVDALLEDAPLVRTAGPDADARTGVALELSAPPSRPGLAASMTLVSPSAAGAPVVAVPAPAGPAPATGPVGSAQPGSRRKAPALLAFAAIGLVGAAVALVTRGGPATGDGREVSGSASAAVPATLPRELEAEAIVPGYPPRAAPAPSFAAETPSALPAPSSVSLARRPVRARAGPPVRPAKPLPSAAPAPRPPTDDIRLER